MLNDPAVAVAVDWFAAQAAGRDVVSGAML
jgi:hypothetical protein